MFGRRKREQAGIGIHDAYLAAGWIETPLSAVDGAWQAFGSGALSDAVSFFPTEAGPSADVRYPFRVFDYVQIEPNAELHEAVRTKHALAFNASDSPSHLIGYIGDGHELYVILPMQTTSEQWVELFRRHGVKVMPSVEWLEWDTAAWDPVQRDRLKARLNAEKVPHLWDGDLLRSAKQNEEAMTGVLSSFDPNEET
jgi:hypothetical protein